MAEVLVEFDTTLRGSDGCEWHPRVWGQICEDALWEGWIEFLPAGTNDREAIRTGRETEQPKRLDLLYWAQGLTQVYLEGALERAIRQTRGASVWSHATQATPEQRPEPEVRATRSSSR